MAECVYGWLGDGNAASEQALKFLKKQSRLSTRLPLSILRSNANIGNVDSLPKYRQVSWSDMVCEFGPRSLMLHTRPRMNTTDSTVIVYLCSQVLFITSMDERVDLDMIYEVSGYSGAGLSKAFFWQEI